MEVCFADVAQGSASVILLGDRRAIVIDCGGRQARTVLELLSRLQVETIAGLAVTHNHADHSAGAAAVLTAFRQRVEAVWMIYDTVLRDSLFWARLNEEITAGRIDRRNVRRLECRDTPEPVYRAAGVLVAVLAPDLLGNIAATEQNNPNATSGVLVLKRHGQQVVFAGDSTAAEWREIERRRGAPINCQILTVPHHAGRVWADRQPGESDNALAVRIEAELDWLYTRGVRAETAVISVGSSNSHKHPRPEVVSALRRRGSVVLCTQMTTQCEPNLEDQRRRALPLTLPSRSSARPQRTGRRGVSSNVACAGTIIAELSGAGVVIRRLGDHQAIIAGLPTGPTQGPLCRR